jgi:hypothetical protein
MEQVSEQLSQVAEKGEQIMITAWKQLSNNQVDTDQMLQKVEEGRQATRTACKPAVASSVADPDPFGGESFSRIGS